MVTIYDIAKKANVSPMTVSRVINGSGSIKDTTKKRVEKAIEELNYIPNSNARSLTSKKTKLISLLIADITNPFFTNVARGAEDKAMQLGYQILLSNSDENVTKEADYINMILSTRVDGVIMAPTGDDSLKQIKILKKHNIPVVLIDREIDNFEGDLVIGDNYKGSRRLIEHLIQLDHKRIALINGPQNISTARERYRGYVETLKLNDLEINKKYITSFNYKSDEADKIIKSLFKLPKNERPTAIFAANNFIAASITHSLEKYSLKVPEDISIVCFDDIQPIASFKPFFTVASQPAYSYGFLSAQFLIERIEKTAPKDSRRILLPSEFIERQSTTRNSSDN